jgi:hypothetical protein
MNDDKEKEEEQEDDDTIQTMINGAIAGIIASS